ncbi:MAG: fructosamine kinase family protein, partial [Pseudonocardiaceae bacterium]
IRLDPTRTQLQLWNLDDGTPLFAKLREGAPASFFASEAQGLGWLAETKGPRIPEVIAAGEELLVLEYIAPGEPSRSGAAVLGEQLAVMHDYGSGREFGAPAGGGAPMAGFVGDLPLDNSPSANWPEFFLTRRCLPYLRQATDSGTFSPAQAGEIERLLTRLAQRSGAPEPAARIHGDLWSGNVHYDTKGAPWLVDAAAAHWGHRETDLATLQLFGAPFLDVTLASYNAALPLAAGWRERVRMHQLHLLLVHAVLFGPRYAEQVFSAARSLR